jgi:hypothetical protein
MNRRKNRRQFASVILMASLAVAVICLLIPMSASAADDTAKAEQDRVKAAGDALDELVTKRTAFPRGLLNKSECVIILPSVKSWFHHRRPIWPRTDELPERREI